MEGPPPHLNWAATIWCKLLPRFSNNINNCNISDCKSRPFPPQTLIACSTILYTSDNSLSGNNWSEFFSCNNHLSNTLLWYVLNHRYKFVYFLYLLIHVQLAFGLLKQFTQLHTPTSILFLDHSSIYYCLWLNLMLIDNEPTVKGMVLCTRIWHDGVYVWSIIVPGHQHDRVHWSVGTRMMEHSPLCMCGEEEQVRAWVGYLNHQTMGHPHTTR